MKNVIAACALFLTAALPAEAANITPIATDLPAGSYTVDKAHTSLIVRLSHLGFSMFTARFTGVDIKLDIDPKHPERAKLEATIDPNTLESDNPPAGFLEELRGAQWLNAKLFPKVTYRATEIELTGPKTAKITGDLTLHGVTKPVVLNATFNGGYQGFEMDPRARAGLSVRGTFKRSDFGITIGIPAPGSNLGVSDEVEVIIETELNGPAWHGAKKPE